MDDMDMPVDCDANVDGPALNFDDFMKMVKKAKLSTATGMDGIPLKAIEWFDEPIQEAIHRITCDWINGDYPPLPEWIRSRVVLLSKGAGTNPNRIEERRPISILNAIYKIVASVLDKWLQSHMRAHPAQFGFQKNVSTCGALVQPE